MSKDLSAAASNYLMAVDKMKKKLPKAEGDEFVRGQMARARELSSAKGRDPKPMRTSKTKQDPRSGKPGPVPPVGKKMPTPVPPPEKKKPKATNPFYMPGD
jgi:hypothetical protein